MGASSATSRKWPKATSPWPTRKWPNRLPSDRQPVPRNRAAREPGSPGPRRLKGALDQCEEAGAVDEAKVVAVGEVPGLLAELPRGQHHRSLCAGAAHVAVEL